MVQMALHKIYTLDSYLSIAGQYQPNAMSSSCLSCPAGYYCTSSVFKLVTCPARHYCPPESTLPKICPNGTYTLDSETGLERADQCRPCVTSQYCQLGK